MANFIDELSLGDKVEGIYLVVKKSIREKRNGTKFLFLELGDRTGSITAVAWDDVENFLDILQDEKFIKVTGLVNEYNGRPQIVLQGLSEVDPSEIIVENFLTASTQDPEKLKKRFSQLINKVENKYLRTLLNTIFDDKEFYDSFTKAPAAMQIHHSYLNGLLEHTLEVCDLIIATKPTYPQIDHDLILTGALLHDIGKVEEYRIGGGIEYTEEGKLLGHIVIGYDMIRKAIDKIQNFPVQLRTKILHLILSHHGKLEWGSPREPIIPEAFLLHTMDNLSSKMHNLIKKELENEN